MMFKGMKPLALAAGALVVSLAAAQAAEAGERSRSWVGRRGAEAGRTVDRAPGSTVVQRGVTGRNGRGVSTTRATTWGDGSVTNDMQRNYANGETVTRSGSVVANGDGSVDATRTRTGVGGNTQSGWSTVYRSEDGFGRSRGVSTSSGRGVSGGTDVVVGDDSVTVNRSLTTQSGQSRSRSRTYPRR